jgi:predicted SAM-dependent methyltransferase
MRIHLGCGTSKRQSWVGVDISDLPGVDVVQHLTAFPYPFEANTADEILLENILEHLPNTIAVIEECEVLY